MLTVKLAKEAVFGEEVMSRCTSGGTRELPGLPSEELYELKKTVLKQYPQYWKCLHDFEGVWKKCRDSLEQACTCKTKGPVVKHAHVHNVYNLTMYNVHPLTDNTFSRYDYM